MSNITIATNPPDLAERLADKPRFLRRFASVMDKENDLTVGHISIKRMRGVGPFPPSEGRLGVRDRHLSRSLRKSNAQVVGDGVVSAIGSNVKYAGIHEFGGTTRPHEIRARNGKALRFGVGGRATIFRKSVKHPGSKIPARRPIFRGIQDRMANYQDALAKATTDHIEGKTP